MAQMAFDPPDGVRRAYQSCAGHNPRSTVCDLTRPAGSYPVPAGPQFGGHRLNRYDQTAIAGFA